MRFKNRTHVSVTPRIWTTPTGSRIHWRSDIVMFHQFLAQVWDYYDRNGLKRPTEEEIENHLCKQSPEHDCTGKPADPSQRFVDLSNRKGCSTCGKRR